MTIHNLMNAMNVHPEVIILVFDDTTGFCHYIGKYEDCTEGIYNKEIDTFTIEEIKEAKTGSMQVTEVRIYTEG